jgi:predicted transcriptional regulator
MNISDYINVDLKPLDLESRIQDVKKGFKKNKHTHLPVISDNYWQGLLPNEDLTDFDDTQTLADLTYLFEHFFVKATTNWLDVMGAFVQNETDIMPVVNDQNYYMGYYALEDVLEVFYNTPFLKEPGNILVVSHSLKDYAMSQICQIVESNDAKLLGCFVTRHFDERIEVTIKTSQSAINPMLQTFRRYGYEVESEHDEDKLRSNLKERSEYLKKYLNI